MVDAAIGADVVFAGECLVQVFLHMPDQDAAVAARARETDAASGRRGVKTLATEIARGNPAVKSILTGLDGLLTSNPMGKTFDFYFFSLSSHRDHARQWAEYGDHRKGFAIGFAPALFQPGRTDLLPVPNENQFVAQVIYGNDKTATRHRRGVRKLADIITSVQKAYPHLVQGQDLLAGRSR